MLVWRKRHGRRGMLVWLLVWFALYIKANQTSKPA